MKRILLVVAAALMFISTLVTPIVARADGGGLGSNCGGNSVCKP